jgi:hypothetical protein
MSFDDTKNGGVTVRDFLCRQFDIAWALTAYHLDGLTTEECLWRPAQKGLHVQSTDDGRWQADWPDHEGYDIGPASIAWTTWHIGFWWSMALDHSDGDGTLSKDEISWPGSADAVRVWIDQLQERWRTLLMQCSDSDLRSSKRTRWPIQDRPFGDIVAWVNVELMKNAAEIGLVRFLYAVRAG